MRNTGSAAQNGALSFILVPLHVTSPRDQTANVCMAYVEVSYSPGIEVALLAVWRGGGNVSGNAQCCPFFTIPSHCSMALEP